MLGWKGWLGWAGWWGSEPETGLAVGHKQENRPGPINSAVLKKQNQGLPSSHLRT